MGHLFRFWQGRHPARRFACVLVCAVFLPMSVSTTLARPKGMRVARGNVTFGFSGNTTSIVASDRSIINYSSFDIARMEIVRFIQPSSHASVLNRINSARPTNIDGTLLANGRVFFVNPAGVYIGEHAYINVNQLVASALSLSDPDFLNEQHHFAGGNGSVINHGDISAEKVHLLGKQVVNAGTINSPAGCVVMAVGDRVFLAEPDSDLAVEVEADTHDSPGPVEPIEPVDSVEQDVGIRNEGTIDAPGGKIVLAAAGDVYSHAITNVGTLSASVQAGDAGTVKLTAENGAVSNDGSIQAVSGSGTGGTVSAAGAEIINSGIVEVTGAQGGQVTMEATNRLGQFGAVHANGTATDGGDVSLMAGDVVALGTDSLSTANAGADGDGGEVVVYSPDSALFRDGATIEAKGGSDSGDGGFIEVSGREHVEVFGSVDASAKKGNAGSFLMDPTDITIVDTDDPTTPDLLDPSTGDARSFTSNANANEITDDVIERYLDAGTSVTLDTSDYDTSGPHDGPGNGDITISAAIDPTGGGDYGDVTLTLYAADDIIIQDGAGIDGSGLGAAKLNVALHANQPGAKHNDDPGPEAGDVEVYAEVLTNGGDFASSGVNFHTLRGHIETHGGNIELNHSGDVTVNGLIAGDGSVTIAAAGAIRDAADDSAKPSVDVIGATIDLIAGSGGIGTPVSGENRVPEMAASTELSADTTADGADILIDSIGDLPVGHINAGTIGNVTLSATGAIRDAADDAREPDQFPIQKVDIIGATIDLTARAGGIGTAVPTGTQVQQGPFVPAEDRVLEVAAHTVFSADTSHDSGDILVDSTNDLLLGHVNANKKGNVSLYSTGAIRDAVDDAAKQAADVIGATISLTADSGGIGTPTSDQDRVLEVTASAMLNADTTADGSDTFIHSVGDLPVGLIDAYHDAISIGDVTLTSTHAINDHTDDRHIDVKTVDIIANKLKLKAVDEISAVVEDLETDVAIISAETTGGAHAGIHIWNAHDSGVEIREFKTVGGAIDFSQNAPGDVLVERIGVPPTINGDILVGDVDLFAVSGELTLADSVASAGKISLQTGLAGGDIEAQSLHADGNISAWTMKNLKLKEPAKAGGTITLESNNGNVEAQSLDADSHISISAYSAEGKIVFHDSRPEPASIATNGGSVSLRAGEIYKHSNNEDSALGIQGASELTLRDTGAGPIKLEEVGGTIGSTEIFVEDMGYGTINITSESGRTHVGIDDNHFIKSVGQFSSFSYSAWNGDIKIEPMTTSDGDISLESMAGDVILNGSVIFRRGGVRLIAPQGKIRSAGENDTLNVNIAGYSDKTEGVDLFDPYDPFPFLSSASSVRPKAAIVIVSQDDLKLGPGAMLTAKGSYETGVDDRSGVGFPTVSGDPMDVAIYIHSLEGNVTVNSGVSIDTGGTMVIDAQKSINNFGEIFKKAWTNNAGQNRLELVSRITQTLDQAVVLGTLPHAQEARQGVTPDWFRGSRYVLRGGSGGLILANIATAPLPVPLPLFSVPVEEPEKEEEQLVAWLEAEGIEPYLEGVFREMLSTDLRLIKAAKRLRDYTAILEGATDAQIQALIKTLSWIVEHPVPINSSIASFDEYVQGAKKRDETLHARTGREWFEWVDALIEYARILKTDFDWPAIDCVDKVMWEYVIRLEVDDHRFLIKEYLSRILDAEDETFVTDRAESK